MLPIMAGAGAAGVAGAASVAGGAGGACGAGVACGACGAGGAFEHEVHVNVKIMRMKVHLMMVMKT